MPRLVRVLVVALICLGLAVASATQRSIASIDRLQPDAVFLDIQMPGLDAFDVLAAAEHAPAEHVRAGAQGDRRVLDRHQGRWSPDPRARSAPPSSTSWSCGGASPTAS